MTSNPRGTISPSRQPNSLTGACPSAAFESRLAAQSRPTMNGRGNDSSIRNLSSSLKNSTLATHSGGGVSGHSSHRPNGWLWTQPTKISPSPRTSITSRTRAQVAAVNVTLSSVAVVSSAGTWHVTSKKESPLSVSRRRWPSSAPPTSRSGARAASSTASSMTCRGISTGISSGCGRSHASRGPYPANCPGRIGTSTDSSSSVKRSLGRGGAASLSRYAES